MKDVWGTARFGDVLTIVNGRNQRAVEAPDGRYPIHGSGGVIGRATDYLCQTGTTMIGRKGSINSPIYVEEPFWNVDTAFGLMPGPDLDSRLLYRFCESYDFSRHDRGTALPSQVKSELLTIPMPHPPLDEQRRVAAILDEALADVAAAESNSQNNLEMWRALLASQLDSDFGTRVPGWMEAPLDQLFAPDCTLSYGIVQPGQEYPDGVPVVRPVDLVARYLGLSGLKRIDPAIAQAYRRTELQGGELLLCVRGTTGSLAVAADELAGANVTRGIVPIRFNEALVHPGFGFHALSSGAVQRQIRKKTYGTALMQINIRDLRNLRIGVPPLGEQVAIAAELDQLRVETERLEAGYRRKLAALEELMQALLHQGLSGQL